LLEQKLFLGGVFSTTKKKKKKIAWKKRVGPFKLLDSDSSGSRSGQTPDSCGLQAHC
jgi:hypothetical protein